MERMLAQGRQRRQLFVPELGQTDPALVHDDAEQGQLELHPPVLGDAPALDLDTTDQRVFIAGERERGRRRRSECRSDELGHSQEILVTSPVIRLPAHIQPRHEHVEVRVV